MCIGIPGAFKVLNFYAGAEADAGADNEDENAKSNSDTYGVPK